MYHYMFLKWLASNQGKHERSAVLQNKKNRDYIHFLSVREHSSVRSDKPLIAEGMEIDTNMLLAVSNNKKGNTKTVFNHWLLLMDQAAC